MIADGLLQQDTSENPYRAGRLLSLTPQGEAVLREARTATPGVSAALSRSNAPANPGHRADSAALPVTTQVDKPSRSRCPLPVKGHSLSAPSQPVSIYSIDAQRIDDALARIGPKWTTWSAMTLAEANGPMRVRDIANRLPFVNQPFVSKRLATMHADGLLTRDGDHRGAPYRLSALGESLAPVYATISDWSRAHLSPGPMAEAERVEDALRRLDLRQTTAVIQALGGGPRRFVHIAEEVGMEDSWARHRLLRLQADGLVTRTGSRHGDPYVLTEAGQALGAVYASVEHWSGAADRYAPSAPHPVAAAKRTHAGIPPLGGDNARTAVALRRSAATPNALFSHAPQPQPRVPAAVTAHSAPGRGR
ncbi:winged helix-turn-helix transcriptional regulator [Streptomyces sp. BV129]|nr:winged helix-turn-helix transcriptional regulator [Streptomyces sp. BV129]